MGVTPPLFGNLAIVSENIGKNQHLSVSWLKIISKFFNRIDYGWEIEKLVEECSPPQKNNPSIPCDLFVSFKICLYHLNNEI